MAIGPALHPPPSFRTDPAAPAPSTLYNPAAMTATRRAALAAASLALAVPRRVLAQASAITGAATYRERMALPPGAVLEVELLDISRADAPADRIAVARIEVQGQVPIRFSLPFDPARIDERHRYSVSARLSVRDQVVFRSDRVNPVLTRGAGREVDILLVRARPEASGDAGLVGPVWVAEDITGRGVVDRLQSTITFGADGRAYGSGGCNRFTGGYTLDGTSLRIGQMAQTNMACVEAAMDQEQRFHQALGAVRGFRIENGILHLTDDRGATVLRLARGQ